MKTPTATAVIPSCPHDSPVSFIAVALAKGRERYLEAPTRRCECGADLVFAWQGSQIRAFCDPCQRSPNGRPFWPRAEFTDRELEGMPEWSDPTGPGVRQIGLFGSSK